MISFITQWLYGSDDIRPKAAAAVKNVCPVKTPEKDPVYHVQFKKYLHYYTYRDFRFSPDSYPVIVPAIRVYGARRFLSYLYGNPNSPIVIQLMPTISAKVVNTGCNRIGCTIRTDHSDELYNGISGVRYGDEDDSSSEWCVKGPWMQDLYNRMVNLSKKLDAELPEEEQKFQALQKAKVGKATNRRIDRVTKAYETSLKLERENAEKVSGT